MYQRYRLQCELRERIHLVPVEISNVLEQSLECNHISIEGDDWASSV